MLPADLTTPHRYSREDIVALLSLTGDDQRRMFAAADAVRHEVLGDMVHLRGIIEISNACDRDCLYCGLRYGNLTLSRFRLEPEDILAQARLITSLPVRSIVLQSGEANSFTREEITQVVTGIRSATDAGITLSLGEREREDYEAWYEAGADRYLLKHETRNPALFARLKPDTDMDSRTACLWTLRDIGYQVGTGNMVGLPGQTLEDIADDIIFCRELDADMCSFGPFIASPATPLAAAANGTVDLSLRTIAVARLVLRTAHIPANTAIGTLDPEGRRKALQCGANVIMPNFTPAEQRARYEIYPNARRHTDDALTAFDGIQTMILSLGRTIATDAGHSLKRPGRRHGIPSL